MRAGMGQAAALGGREIYFTVESRETTKLEALARLNFREVDAGIYMIRDAD